MVVGERELVCSILGETVRALFRVYFQDSNGVDKSDGGLTIEFDSGRVLRFDGTPHGCGLSLHTSRSVSPFAESASDAPEGIAQGGLYREIDVSAEDEYRDFIGQAPVSACELVYRPHEEAAGICLHFSNSRELYVFNLADVVIVRRWVDLGEFYERFLCGLSPHCAGDEGQRDNG